MTSEHENLNTQLAEVERQLREVNACRLATMNSLALRSSLQKERDRLLLRLEVYTGPKRRRPTSGPSVTIAIVWTFLLLLLASLIR